MLIHLNAKQRIFHDVQSEQSFNVLWRGKRQGREGLSSEQSTKQSIPRKPAVKVPLSWTGRSALASNEIMPEPGQSHPYSLH